MLRQTGRESAKIIPFPARHRAAPRGFRLTEAAFAELRTQQVPVCDYGSGWYHDAAIQDAQPARKS